MQVLKGELPAWDGARREPDCDPSPHFQGSVSSLKTVTVTRGDLLHFSSGSQCFSFSVFLQMFVPRWL